MTFVEKMSAATVATLVGVAAGFLAFSVGGCKSKLASEKRATSSVSSAIARSSVKPLPTVSAAPIPKVEVKAAVNPTNLPVYSGPTGIVEGVVRITGDKPTDVPLQLPPACMGAERTYGKIFREGDDRRVADVLVAVTGYNGYVPQKGEKVEVQIERCAFSSRTIAMTFGQRLEVQNIDAKTSYIPVLHGSKFTAYIVALPTGDPVRLYPHRVGQFRLADNMKRHWMSADVFALKYATHDVTDLDGKFRVEGIPVGEVKVSALLPSIKAWAEKKVTVKEGETTELELELNFDLKKYEAGVPSARPVSSVPQAPMVQ
ncbi:MAG: hypothetical protein CSA75_01835 [Sorangium cellulosum]|nr:MAG: hypothetical protein CSA75_01835 [Sorangium cellulosum]